MPMGMTLADPNADTLPLDAQTDAPDVMSPDEVMAQRRRAVEALYGSQCPMLMDKPTDEDWCGWAQWLWSSRSEFMTPLLHRAEKIRLFRAGVQWISQRGNGPWREPPRPKDVVRRVINMMGPALDWRLQVLSEQRPGVRVKPATQDPDDVRRATASNLVLDYAYYAQSFSGMLREAAYWSQTDGVSFLRTYWDDTAGRMDPMMGAPLGDPQTKVYRLEQVRVSSNATSNTKPLWWVLRETMPKAHAVALYGPKVADEGLAQSSDMIGLSSMNQRRSALDQTMFTGTVSQNSDADVVDRYTVFLEPNAMFMPKGLELVTVGGKVVSLGPIQCGIVPMARLTDGSADPAFYPVPVAEMWIDDQMALNAVESKLVENIRRNAGGRVLAKAQSLVTETLRGGNDSIIEVRAPGSLSDVIQPMQGFSIGQDVEMLRAALIKRIEDLTGYNDTARGAMSANASGRAILAVREQLERVFAPSIYAASNAAREWAKQTLAWTHWGYSVPRIISTLGNGRPDLGRAISGDDIDDDVDVELEAETMFPVPRSVRRFELDNQLQMGVIDVSEYRRRLNFADTGDMGTPDAVQEARAMRVCDAIRTGAMVPPMLWQDNEAIQQDVLERELILAPGTPDDQMATAQQRWQELAQQHATKQSGVPMPPPGGAPGGAPPTVPDGLTFPPQSAPTGSLPGNALPAQPLMQQQTTQTQAANLFERTAPQ